MATPFKPIEVTDPITGEKKILTPEEVEELLEKGVFLGPASDNKEGKKS